MIRIYQYGEVPNSEIFARRDTAYDVSGVVSDIIDNVVRRGDEALFAYTKKFDKVDLDRLEVTPEEFEEALSLVEPEYLDIIREAAQNIRAYHEKQKRNDYLIQERDGVILGMKVTPIEKVGLYVPNGTAAYPSTVMMNIIPW